jgi:hypothetical protein
MSICGESQDLQAGLLNPPPILLAVLLSYFMKVLMELYCGSMGQFIGNCNGSNYKLCSGVGTTGMPGAPTESKAQLEAHTVAPWLVLPHRPH